MGGKLRDPTAMIIGHRNILVIAGIIAKTISTVTGVALMKSQLVR